MNDSPVLGVSVIQKMWKALLYQDLLLQWQLKHMQQQAAMEQEARESRERRIQAAQRNSSELEKTK